MSNTKSIKAGERTQNANYCVIGSETHVAATEWKSSLSQARRFCKAAKFSNGRAALCVIDGLTKQQADQWVQRSNVALAYVSGRLGRWITPSFVAVNAQRVAK